MRYELLFMLTFILCGTTTVVSAQEFFEGKIVYEISHEAKDSSFDVNRILNHPATQSTLIFKSGRWVNAPNAGIIDFGYFNWMDNRQYYKFIGVDSLVYDDYSTLTTEMEPIITQRAEYNIDTILGLICNRLILQTKNMTLTIVYHPSIAVNPRWFSKTKGGYYDRIYAHTKSLYLMSIVETARYKSMDKAISIEKMEISDDYFDSKDALSKRPVDGN